jgi:hypothetical protein
VAHCRTDADGHHGGADDGDRDAGHVGARHLDQAGRDRQAEQRGEAGDLHRHEDERVRGHRAQGRRHRCMGRGRECARAAPYLPETAYAEGQHDQGRNRGEHPGGRSVRHARDEPGDHRNGHECRGAGGDQDGQGAGSPAKVTRGARARERVGDQPGGEPGRGERAGEDEVHCDVHIDSLHPRIT